MRLLPHIAGARPFSRIKLLMLWCITGCLAILLFPPQLLTETGFALWRDAHTPYIVLAMLLASAALLTPLLAQGWETLEGQLGFRLRSYRFQRLVAYLDANEKAVLREFVLQRQSALRLPVDDPAVNNLLQTGFLQPSDTPALPIAANERLLSVALAARPHLTRKVLNLPVRKLTEHELQWLRNSRPKFVCGKGSMAL